MPDLQKRLQAQPGFTPEAMYDGATDAATYRRRWHACTLWLLALWVVVSFVVPWFARSLSFSVFGWTFSYWMCVQGALLVYCGITIYYAWYMTRLDARHGLDEDPQGY